MEIRGRNRSRGLFMSEEIIIDIATRLPVKSLMRFKAICKLWNSIISDDPHFAELHHKEWIQKPRLFFVPLMLKGQYWIYGLRENGVKAKKLQRLPFDYLNGNMITEFEHSSGALLLFKSQNFLAGLPTNQPTFFVYDSISGNQILLPGLPMRIDHQLTAVLMYDVSNKMHKVLVYAKGLLNFEFIDCCCVTSFCNKTMTSENVWRMVPAPVEGKLALTSNTSVKNIMYWLVDRYVMVKETFIKPFDIAEEKFLNIIRCPDEISKLKIVHNPYNLLEIRGALGFMLMTLDEFQIWVLTDSDNSSWNLLHKMNMRTVFDRPNMNLSRVVFVLEKINSLPSILLNYKKMHFWYEMDGKKAKKMNVEDLANDSYCCISAWIP